jgi:hypothetical protein
VIHTRRLEVSWCPETKMTYGLCPLDLWLRTPPCQWGWNVCFRCNAQPPPSPKRCERRLTVVYFSVCAHIEKLNWHLYGTAPSVSRVSSTTTLCVTETLGSIILVNFVHPRICLVATVEVWARVATIVQQSSFSWSSTMSSWHVLHCQLLTWSCNLKWSMVGRFTSSFLEQNFLT